MVRYGVTETPGKACAASVVVITSIQLANSIDGRGHHRNRAMNMRCRSTVRERIEPDAWTRSRKR